MRRIAPRLCLCAALTLLIDVFLAEVAVGQPVLRWKFRTGDQFEIITAQDVTITAEVAKESMRMSHRTVVQIGWEVASVEPTGQATIVQKIERLKVKLTSPGMDELIYDTVATKSPTGPVKQIAAALTPLLKTSATLKIDPRGRVNDVQLDSGSSKIDAPAGRPFKQFLTGAGGLELSGLSYLILPAGPVTANSPWSHTSPVRLAIGTFQREATYQRTESRRRGDRLLPTVTLRWKLIPAADAEPALPGEPERQPPVRIEVQKNEGVFVFDSDAGHAVQASLQQQMTVVSQVASRDVKQQIVSSTKMKMDRLSGEKDRR